MEETEENSSTIGDWRSLISSPRGLFSAFVSDGFGSSSGSNVTLSDKVDDFQTSSQKKSGGSIAERRAARCGFNAARLNTARFRSDSPLSSPGVRSPYLTLPLGVSPSTLLDSPVMLPNSQAQLSPTTGTFPFPSFSHESPIPISVTYDTDKDKSEVVDSSYIFNPHVDLVSLSCLSSAENQVSSTTNPAQHLGMADLNNQSMDQMQSKVDIECQGGFLQQSMTKNYANESLSDLDGSNNLMAKVNPITLQACSPSVNDQPPQHEETSHGEDVGSQQLLEEDQKGPYPLLGMGRPSEDGYNWRKYGQKQVKGSEFPRSYYKCTHPNCQVKKKVERSHDGQITEIIYKGTHSHPKPQPSRRSAIGSTFPLNDMLEIPPEGSASCVKVGMDWMADGLERTSSTSVVTELSDPLSTTQLKHLGVLESEDNPERSSTHASPDDDDDGATQGSISLGDDGEDDESESKRRKKDSCLIETNLASRAVREPRVVVQTDSEVDILDDGYRWRKYGQKVVKGNPNPRSYYKCTNVGCSVRKHVERASHDLKAVITTYEGKHNHEVPAARNNNQMNSGGRNPPPSSNSQSTRPLSGSANIPNCELQVQDLAPRFERKLELSNEYLKSGYIGRFTGDIKLGSHPCFEMNLPPLQPMSFASLGHNEAHQAASVGPVVPEFPLSFPMGLHRPSNLMLPSFDFNNGKSVGVSQSYLGLHPKDIDMGFLRPKQEQMDDSISEARPPINHNASPPLYRQIMGGYPL
ncbi:WRKY transcription factor SUSIBA2-like [Tasmannia lanceolata]|uniref:WRKY transcription factor SUSIBA2-like n=1 Tax=Tasmannia lanceolata TaxID=3420 RepID=UPI0040630EAD